MCHSYRYWAPRLKTHVWMMWSLWIEYVPFCSVSHILITDSMIFDGIRTQLDTSSNEICLPVGFWYIQNYTLWVLDGLDGLSFEKEHSWSGRFYLTKKWWLKEIGRKKRCGLKVKLTMVIFRYFYNRFLINLLTLIITEYYAKKWNWNIFLSPVP